jgi:hypothetical protein
MGFKRVAFLIERQAAHNDLQLDYVKPKEQQKVIGTRSTTTVEIDTSTQLVTSLTFKA